MKTFLMAICSLIMVVSFVGCGGGGDFPDTVPMECTITMDGVAVEGAIVSFLSEDGEYSGSGQTDAEGVAIIETFEAEDGVVPSSYIVTVRKVEITETSASSDPGGAVNIDEKFLVNEKYSRRSSSGLAVTVTTDGPNEVTFDLED
jgi:hypothetical protein